MAEDDRIKDDSIQVQLVWTSPEDRPFVFTNQYACQFTGDTFLLTFGSVPPPIILGTTKERMEAALRIQHLPVQVEGRFTMGRRNVEDLVRILNESLAKHDEQERKEGKR